MDEDGGKREAADGRGRDRDNGGLRQDSVSNLGRSMADSMNSDVADECEDMKMEMNQDDQWDVLLERENKFECGHGEKIRSLSPATHASLASTSSVISFSSVSPPKPSSPFNTSRRFSVPGPATIVNPSGTEGENDLRHTPYSRSFAYSSVRSRTHSYSDQVDREEMDSSCRNSKDAENQGVGMSSSTEADPCENDSDRKLFGGSAASYDPSAPRRSLADTQGSHGGRRRYSGKRRLMLSSTNISQHHRVFEVDRQHYLRETCERRRRESESHDRISHSSQDSESNRPKDKIVRRETEDELEKGKVSFTALDGDKQAVEVAVEGYSRSDHRVLPSSSSEAAKENRRRNEEECKSDGDSTQQAEKGEAPYERMGNPCRGKKEEEQEAANTKIESTELTRPVLSSKDETEDCPRAIAEKCNGGFNYESRNAKLSLFKPSSSSASAGESISSTPESSPPSSLSSSSIAIMSSPLDVVANSEHPSTPPREVASPVARGRGPKRALSMLEMDVVDAKKVTVTATQDVKMTVKMTVDETILVPPNNLKRTASFDIVPSGVTVASPRNRFKKKVFVLYHSQYAWRAVSESIWDMVVTELTGITILCSKKGCTGRRLRKRGLCANHWMEAVQGGV